MENNNIPRKIEGAFNPKLQKKTNPFYNKEYYTMFFTIMILTFIAIFWLCNFTKLKEMFQIISLTALSIAIAEYFTRSYTKYNSKNNKQ